MFKLKLYIFKKVFKDEENRNIWRMD